jgi:protein TonB
MFTIAFPRGRGPTFTDLPPTLQPCAVAASAPASDHLRVATIAGLIYAALAASTVVLSNLAPPRILAPARPPDRWRPVVIESAPSAFRPAFHPVPAGGGGEASTTPLVTQPPAPQEAPGNAAAGLPTEDHHQDPVGSGTGTTGIPAPPGTPLGPSPGSAVHDFTSAGLAVLCQVDPAYPDFARRARIQGTVVLLMTVDEMGQPLRVQVLEGHPVFHEAAVQAARQWRFEPARLDGRPVSASFRLTLKFSLR